LTQITLILSLSRPIKGRLAIVTDAGRDAVDAAASGVQRNRRAGFGLCAIIRHADERRWRGR
jgi:hypothetical protein